MLPAHRYHSQASPSYTAAAPATGGPPIDIAVLASGSGTNLQVLLDTATIRPHIVKVISDRADARALERATAMNVDTEVISYSDFPDRDAFSVALADSVKAAGAEAVVLAGFMRVLSPSFIGRFPDRILNIHPSLLPAFPGSRAVESALEHSVKVTGVTVHLVDEKVDNGPIIAQVPVEVLPGDDVEDLHARIQSEEHRIYPQIVQAFIEGRVKVEGRKVTVG